jgi:choline dehydrogenase
LKFTDSHSRYCETQHDVDAFVRGIKAALKIAHTAPLTDLLDHTDTTPALDHHRQLHMASDEKLAAFTRERLETLYHPASTCRMAPLTDGGVVDGQLRVYGVQGLRV